MSVATRELYSIYESKSFGKNKTVIMRFGVMSQKMNDHRRVCQSCKIWSIQLTLRKSRKIKRHVVNLKLVKLRITHWPNWNNQFTSSPKIIIFEDLLLTQSFKKWLFFKTYRCYVLGVHLGCFVWSGICKMLHWTSAKTALI